MAYANALRNSGAAAILLPYRIHRAGSVAEAVQAAQQAVGSESNPVVDVRISDYTMTIIFQDGDTREETLPAGMTGGTEDQVARDAAAGAQSNGGCCCDCGGYGAIHGGPVPVLRRPVQHRPSAAGSAQSTAAYVR